MTHVPRVQDTFPSLVGPCVCDTNTVDVWLFCPKPLAFLFPLPGHPHFTRASLGCVHHFASPHELLCNWLNAQHRNQLPPSPPIFIYSLKLKRRSLLLPYSLCGDRDQPKQQWLSLNQTHWGVLLSKETVCWTRRAISVARSMLGLELWQGTVSLFPDILSFFH